MSTDVYVGALNCQGLSRDKFATLKTHMGNKAYDILFLIETWYVDHDRVMADDFVRCSTVLRTQRKVGHQNGGIVCLVHPCVRKLVSSVVVTEYSIRVNIRNKWISCVYLPPRLPLDTYLSELNACMPSDMLLGDINADMSRPQDARVCALRSLQRQYNLQHLRDPDPSRQSRTDHAFVRSPNNANLEMCMPPVATDHKFLLEVRLDVDTAQPMRQQPQQLQRYHVRKLQNRRTANRLVKTVEDCFTDLTDQVQALYASFADLSPSERHDLVEATDELIVAGLDECCTTVLGRYDVADARQRPDSFAADIAACATEQQAVTQYKRCLRAQSVVSNICSRTTAQTPADDAHAYFTEMYAQPMQHLAADPVQHDELVGDPDLADFLDSEILDSIISRYPSMKACGSDSLHILIIKAAWKADAFCESLTTLFRMCAAAGHTPSRWNVSLLCPIPKKTEAKYISDMRPIALTEMFRRLFEAGILRYIATKQHTASLRRFHPAQAGFRKGYSTETQALAAHESCVRHNLHQVFLDFKAAYDSVPVKRLLVKLRDRGASDGLVSIIRSLFLHCQSRAVVNHDLTDVIIRERGLFQGSLLSPTLFNIYIDDLAELMTTTFPNAGSEDIPSCLLFADDVKLQHLDPAAIQMMIDQAATWATTNGMTYNVAKCATFTAASVCQLVLAGQVIPVVSVYKYLGFPHRQKGIDWKQHMHTNVDKATKVLKFMRSKGDHWLEVIRLILYKTYIRPLCEYGAAAMYHCQAADPQCIDFAALTTLNNDACEWIVGVRQRAAAVRSVCGIPDVRDRLYALAVRFREHVRNANAANPALIMARKFLHNRDTALIRKRSILPRTIADSLLDNLPDPDSQCISSRLKKYHLQCFQKEALASYITPDARQKPQKRTRQPQQQQAQDETQRSQNQQQRQQPQERQAATTTVRSDHCLRISDPLLRRQCLTWRCNMFGQRKTCLRCNTQFNRAHVDRCHLFDEITVDNVVSDMHASDLQRHPYLAGRTYTTLDCVLNHPELHHVLPGYFAILSISIGNRRQQSGHAAASSSQHHSPLQSASQQQPVPPASPHQLRPPEASQLDQAAISAAAAPSLSAIDRLFEVFQL